jgi:hypothetical protein
VTFAAADSPILLLLLCLRVFSAARFLGVGSAAGCLNKLLLAGKGLNILNWGRGIVEIGGRCQLCLGCRGSLLLGGFV